MTNGSKTRVILSILSLISTYLKLKYKTNQKSQRLSVRSTGNGSHYVNQSINQFIYFNMWDGVAQIIRARGSCIKRVTIKILS